MKLNTVLEAKYHNQPDAKHLANWKREMISSIEDDWYNGYDSWEDFEEHGLGNPTNSIEELWGKVPEEFEEWYNNAYDEAVAEVREVEDTDEDEDE